MPSTPSKVCSMDDVNNIVNVATTTKMKTTKSNVAHGSTMNNNNSNNIDNASLMDKQSLIPSYSNNSTTGNITVTINNNSNNNHNNKKSVSNTTQNKQPKFKNLNIDGVAIVPKTPVPGLAAALQASGVRVISSPSDLQQHSISIPLNVNNNIQYQNSNNNDKNSIPKPLTPSLPIPPLPPPPPPPPLLTTKSPTLMKDQKSKSVNNTSKGLTATITPIGSPSTRSKSTLNINKQIHEHNTRRSIASSNKQNDHNYHQHKQQDNIILNPPKLPKLNPPPLPPNHPNWSSQSLKSLYNNSSNPNLSLPVLSPPPTLSSSYNNTPSSSPTFITAAISDLNVIEKLLNKKMRSLQSELKDIESSIDIKEHDYITETWSHGNVIRGWDNFLRRAERSEKAAAAAAAAAASSTDNITDPNNTNNVNNNNASNNNIDNSSNNNNNPNPNKSTSSRKARVSDHIFSLSSSTSKVRRHNPDVSISKRPSVISKKKKKRG